MINTTIVNLNIDEKKSTPCQYLIFPSVHLKHFSKGGIVSLCPSVQISNECCIVNYGRFIPLPHSAKIPLLHEIIHTDWMILI